MNSQPPSPRAIEFCSSLSRLALVLALAAICYAQGDSLATFGTTVVIPGGLTGKIYNIPPSSGGLPKFDKLEPVGTIYAKGLAIPPTEFTEGFPGVTNRIEWFAIDFNGRFYIPNPGSYRFRLCSDDGSKLYFDGKVVIDNDGIHGTRCLETGVKLSGGIHTIRLSYFQGPRYHLCLILGVQKPGATTFRPFNTDDFAAPENPADWKYGSLDSLVTPPDSDIGRRNLKDEFPSISVSAAVLSHGEPVRGLQPADFVVRDAGELRDIASLTFGTDPLDIVLLTDGSHAEELQSTARRAVAQLQPQDRVALIVFGEKPVLALGLALNRDILLSAIQKIQPPLAANDLDRSIAPVTRYLRDYGRAQATSAIVLVSNPANLLEIFRSLHQRYRLTWRTDPKTSRAISVDLTPQAKARFGEVTIQAEVGPVVLPAAGAHTP
jgi:hypothetical protein